MAGHDLSCRRWEDEAATLGGRTRMMDTTRPAVTLGWEDKDDSRPRPVLSSLEGRGRDAGRKDEDDAHDLL